MSATPTRALEGTQTPAPFEVLWERYRSLIVTVLIAVFAALGVNYGLKYFNQRAEDKKVSAFVASLGAKDFYVDVDKSRDSLTEALANVSLESLENAAQGADRSEKALYLLAIARKAMLEKKWDVAERALGDLETGYPEHSLVRKSKFPVQVRDQEPPDPKETNPRKKIEWKPAKEGSVVSLMREQIAAERAFALPASYAKPEVPADAQKVRFVLGDYGSFVVALMGQRAPKLTEKFLELARQPEGGFWKGIAVDEVQRPAKGIELPRKLHLGYESTKDDDRTKWSSTEESKSQVDFEDNDLSHFPGAVAATPGTDGRACADRFWINVDDLATEDGEQVVFGFVVEGLDVLKRVCEAGMSAQEEERGTGRPTENIRVTAVEVLQ